MAADSSMGFHQEMVPPFYSHHMLSFQSTATVDGSGVGTVPRGTSGSLACASGSSMLFGAPNVSGLVSGTAQGVVTPASSSVGASGIHSSMPKYKFVTGSPADWSANELAILKEGLIRYAHEPNIMKYIKIAAMIPTKTVRDVALRCWWNGGKENNRRRKPEDQCSGKRAKDLKEKMVASTSVANIHMAPSHTGVPFSYPTRQWNQNSRFPTDVTILDHATQQLLLENNQLLTQMTANLDSFKMQENIDLVIRTSNNIRVIMNRMSEMPGIMSRMPPLPVCVNDDSLNSMLQLQLQLNGLWVDQFSSQILSYSDNTGMQLKQEPMC